jgi:hypothetical protein
MQGILTNMSDAQMRPGQLPDSFLAVGTPFLPPGNHPLQQLDLAQVSFQGTWVLYPGSIAERRQRQNPEIHPHNRLIGSFWVGYLHLHLNRHEPTSSAFPYRCTQAMDTFHREITALF